MNNIRPVSDLRNHFAEISRIVHDGTIVFLTKNGYGDMVVMSTEAYEKRAFQQELYYKLMESTLEAQNNPVFYSQEEVFGPLYDDLAKRLAEDANDEQV